MSKWCGAQQSDGRCFASAAERNKGPILDVLGKVLLQRGLVLEVASGTGQHVVHFANAFPTLTWQPSDPDPQLREAIRLRIEDERLANVNAPLDLDVERVPWPVASADALVCINMIHISPWAACEGLMAGAGAILPAGGVLFLYGPFLQTDQPTAPSNLAFDADLKARNPAWGLRSLEAVAALAERNGLRLRKVVPMPANNLSVVFTRTQP